jgi:hypothetical protein
MDKDICIHQLLIQIAVDLEIVGRLAHRLNPWS